MPTPSATWLTRRTRSLNREFHGPDYSKGPQTTLYHPHANSPAPHVSSSHPAAHPFTAAGSGQRVVYLPTGVDLPDPEAEAS